MKTKSGNNDKNINIDIDLPDTIHENDINVVKNIKNNDMKNHKLLNVHSITINNNASHDREAINLITLKNNLNNDTILRSNKDSDVEDNVITCSKNVFNDLELINKR